MQTTSSKTWLRGNSLRSHFVAHTLGRSFAWLLQRSMRLGRIKIEGHERFLDAAENGRTMILTNHPSLLAETFLLGALASHLYLPDPKRALWTMPDARLLDGWRIPQWLRDDMHCIVTHREDEEAKARAAITAVGVLRRGGTIIAHPEEGRTFGSANAGKKPIECNGRLMQDISASRVLAIASTVGARVLPGWIDVPHASAALPLSECLRRLMREDEIITFSFRQPPYRIEGKRKQLDLVAENRRLQHLIFHA